MNYLLSSVAAALALTAVLNVIIQAFPGTSAQARALQVFGEEPLRPDELPPPDEQRRFRLFFPWKQILWWSAALTIIANIAKLFT